MRVVVNAVEYNSTKNSRFSENHNASATRLSNPTILNKTEKVDSEVLKAYFLASAKTSMLSSNPHFVSFYGHTSVHNRNKSTILPDDNIVYDDNKLLRQKKYSQIAKQAFLDAKHSEKSIVSFYDKDMLPDLFSDNLKILVKENMFAKMGYASNSTEIIDVKVGELLEKDSSPVSYMLSKASDAKNANKKPVFIIDDITVFINSLSEKDKLIYHNSGTLHQSPQILLHIAAEDMDSVTELDEFLDYKMIAPEGLTERDTVELLKRKDFQNRFVFEDESKNINITDKAISMAVKAAVKDEKTLPGGAAGILKYAYNLRCLSSDSRQIKNITATDADKAIAELVWNGEDEDGELFESEFKKKVSTADVPKVRFSDVGGMTNVKAQIQEEFLDLINNPEVKKKDLPKGILLDGPPGTGKTLLAAAIAGESGVPCIFTNGSDFGAKYVGESEENVRKLFKNAAQKAKESDKKTCIVFIDEVDALVPKRSDDETGKVSASVVNTVLAEMDGAANKDGSNDYNVIVIAATNRKDMLDPAFLRPGRMDLKYLIDNPTHNKKSRREIIQIHAKNRPFRSEEDKSQIIEDSVQLLAGFSGSEIADVFKKVERMTYKKNKSERFITKEDVLEASMQVKSGIKVELETPEWNNEATVVHEAGHALTSLLMDMVYDSDEPWNSPTAKLHFITNQARGEAAGATYFVSSDENDRYSFASVVADLACSYGGLSTERKIYGGNADGVRGDLAQITKLATTAVINYGLGPKTGALSIDKDDEFMLNLYKNEIKQDIQMFTNLSKKISDEFITFSVDFIQEYLEEYRKNPSLKEEIITAEAFQSRFTTWVEKNNKQEELKELCKNVKTYIKDANTAV